MFAAFFNQFRSRARVRKSGRRNRITCLRPLRLGLEALEDRRLLTADPFTIVMLPDTQFYSDDDYPQFDWIFGAQTQWVADQINEEEENIVFLTHVGDVVQNGDDTDEWDIADPAMAKLDTQVPSLAYGVLAGNHDYHGTYMHTYFSEFVDYFGPERYENWDQAPRNWDGYGYSTASEIDGLNHFQIFTGDVQQYLNISLEWEARQESINWAQTVIDDHPDLPVILSTHEYLTTGGAHSTTSPRDGVDRNYHNGEKIFADLVYPNPQVFMVLSGHFHGVARKESTNVANQKVYEMLADYQNSNDGGDGYLRILEFDPNVTEDSIEVTTYSPTVPGNLTDGDNEFGLDMDFAERFSFPPTARLYAPVDNDAQDQDHLTNTVKVDTPQSQFQIQLYGHSDEIDDATVDTDDDGVVNAGLVSISREGGAMPACSFAYDADSDRITVARPDGDPFEFDEYTITLSTDITDVGERPLPAATELTVVIESSSVLIAKSSQWRYFDEAGVLEEEPEDWDQPSFDDGGWDSGVGQLGYGDSDEGTLVEYGGIPADKYVTTYFRHEFEVSNAAAIEDLTLNLLRDDGAVVYLNGTEIVRSNMPGGTINYLTLAAQQIGDPAEETYYDLTLDSGYLDHLATGVNVIAVEVHQGAVNSSDISFDLELRARQIITSFDESSGVLSVFGTTLDDSITLDVNGSNHVTLNGDELPGPVDADDVTQLNVYGYAGDDTISLADGLDLEDAALSIFGGTGTDQITICGSSGDDMFELDGGEAVMSNSSWTCTAEGFEEVRVCSSDGTDSTDIDWDNLGTDLVLDLLVWDEDGDGDWTDADGNGVTRWLDWTREGTETYPDDSFTSVVIETDTVTVESNRQVNNLNVESGTIAVEQGAELSLVGDLDIDTSAEYLCHLGDGTIGLIDAAGDVTLGANSTLTFQAHGNDKFADGTFTLLEADDLTGTFGTVDDLNAYVSAGTGGDGVIYTESDTITYTLDDDLWWADANFDNVCDMSDFNIWNAHKFTSPTIWREADFDGSGGTDLSDFNIWNAHKFTSGSGRGSAPVGGTASIDVLYNAQTGKLSVDTDGSDLVTLLIEGPEANRITRWDGKDQGMFWEQAYFEGSEQWRLVSGILEDDTYGIATYDKGLSAPDFGTVEFFAAGGIQYTNVRVLSPTPPPAEAVDRAIEQAAAPMDLSLSAALLSEWDLSATAPSAQTGSLAEQAVDRLLALGRVNEN